MCVQPRARSTIRKTRMTGVPRALAAVATVLVLAACSSGAGSAAEEAEVARVIDGDTIELTGGHRVRLVQIDAPELGEGECYARESRRELERLAAPGARIELEPDAELDDTDRYGRLLRYVHRADANVNVELVRRGAATPYFRRGDEGAYADELLDAVDDARRASRGMWGSCRVSWDPERAVTARPR